MTTTQSPRRIDPGRVVAVTLFTLFLLLNAAHLAQEDPLSSPLRTIATALTMAFYVLLIWAYLRRVPSQRTDMRWSSWLVAFAGTAAPFAIPLVSDGLATGTAHGEGERFEGGRAVGRPQFGRVRVTAGDEGDDRGSGDHRHAVLGEARDGRGAGHQLDPGQLVEEAAAAGEAEPSGLGHHRQVPVLAQALQP